MQHYFIRPGRSTHLIFRFISEPCITKRIVHLLKAAARAYFKRDVQLCQTGLYVLFDVVFMNSRVAAYEAAQVLKLCPSYMIPLFDTRLYAIPCVIRVPPDSFLSSEITHLEHIATRVALSVIE